MVGRSVSHYHLLEKLGAGGMGEIYKAQDTRLSRMVAIKALHAAGAGNAERRRRFQQEAQAASALNHPNIITIYDVLFEDETEYIVMEYVSGKTLGDLIGTAGLPVAGVLRYAAQMADALSAAHAAGIVHRDLKPANVMVTESGLVKILDFGLAKLTAPESTFTSLTDATATVAVAPLTVEGSIMGTVSYMSPEQAEGKAVDARSDIFSFGVVLYEMLTGRRPFAGDSPLSTLSAILRDEVRPVSESTANVPPRLDQIVKQCLAKNPASRWQSMQEIRAALTALERDSATMAMGVVAPPVKRQSGSTLIVAVASVLLLAVVGVGWMVRHRAPVTPLPTPVASGTTPASPAEDVLTNDAIIALVRAKVAPATILQHIRASQTRFDLSTSEIIRLSEAGVSPEILDAMRNPKRPASAPSKPSPLEVTGAPVAAPPDTGVPGADKPATPIPPAAPAPPAATQPLAIPDGQPFTVRLLDDVPADAEPGFALRFQVVQALRIGDVTVVAAHEEVSGEVVDGARKKLFGGTKMTYRLKEVTAVDGKKLSLRATPARRPDSRRPVEATSGAKHLKDIAAAAGTEFVAYIDGEQTVAIRK